MKQLTVLFVTAMTAVVLMAGCGGSSASDTLADTTRDTLPPGFYGRWLHTGSSGGITGEGRGEEPSGYIVIGADNTIATFDDDGTLLTSTEFTVSFGDTIFDDTPRWFLGSRVVRNTNSSLSIAQNAYDGITDHYVRAG